MALFALNALLNVLWSELFFGQKRPDWALSEVVPFWLSILVLVLLVFPSRARAAGRWCRIYSGCCLPGFSTWPSCVLNGPFSA